MQTFNFTVLNSKCVHDDVIAFNFISVTLFAILFVGIQWYTPTHTPHDHTQVIPVFCCNYGEVLWPLDLGPKKRIFYSQSKKASFNR